MISAWGSADLPPMCTVRSSRIPHLYLAAVGTIALAEHERGGIKPPFNQSAFGLSPVIKGFPMIHFIFRKRRRFSP
jgi:hypothetical protein